MRDLEREAAAHVQGALAQDGAEQLLGLTRQNAATSRFLFADALGRGDAPAPSPTPLHASRKRRPITAQQRHVLDHLARVELWPFKLQVLSTRRRYTLDGKDCSAQITSLVVRGAVRVRDGRLERTDVADG